MPTHKEIYTSHANEYEALVSREDHEGNILRAVQEILPLHGLDVVDLGAGTGRLACLLAPFVRRVSAFDLSPHMIKTAAERLRRLSPNAWVAATADHRWIPLESHSADLILSGWSVSYLAVWYPDRWRQEAEAWLKEACRVLLVGGHVILFESLGTGNDTPQRLPHLANFYGWLDETGFRSKWIRTDYRFETPEMADQLVGFFFGEEMRANIKRELTTTLPECTGVWWKRL